MQALPQDRHGNKSIELLKEFYSKHQGVIDILADEDDKMFRAVKELCLDESENKNREDVHHIDEDIQPRMINDEMNPGIADCVASSTV
jgi:hypothetical protein